MHLKQHACDLYKGIFVALTKEILKDLNKWEDMLCHELKSTVTILLCGLHLGFIIYFNPHNIVSDRLGVIASSLKIKKLWVCKSK